MNATLRPLEEADLPTLYNMRSDPAVAAQFFNWRPITRTGQVEWYENIRRAPDKLAFVLVGADPTAQGRSAQLQKIVLGFGQISNLDYRNGPCEVGGFMIRPHLQRRGYGRKLVKGIVDFCFEEIGVPKVYLEVLAENKVAIALYVSLGFKTAGVWERHVWKDGGWRDVVLMELFCDR